VQPSDINRDRLGIRYGGTAVLGEDLGCHLLPCGLLLGQVDAAVAALAQNLSHVDGVALDLLHRHQLQTI
jgi:hypothetical protein